MSAHHYSRKLASDPDADAQTKLDTRPSGVRRAVPRLAVELSDEQHASERPTVPAPKCSVVPGATDDYDRIAKGTLASMVEGRLPRARCLHPTQESAAPEAGSLFHAPGSRERVPTRSCSTSDLLKAGLDARQGFVLSLVDGSTSIEGIVDASPMPTEEVLFVLTELVVRGVIGLEG